MPSAWSGWATTCRHQPVSVPDSLEQVSPLKITTAIQVHPQDHTILCIRSTSTSVVVCLVASTSTNLEAPKKMNGSLAIHQSICGWWTAIYKLMAASSGWDIPPLHQNQAYQKGPPSATVQLWYLASHPQNAWYISVPSGDIKILACLKCLVIPPCFSLRN